MSNYRYATGGQTYTCLSCGALVEEESRTVHDGWHEQIAAVRDWLSELYQPESHIIWHREVVDG